MTDTVKYDLIRLGIAMKALTEALKEWQAERERYLNTLPLIPE